MDSKIMRADVHDASFSSYLNTSAESFVLNSARPPVNFEKTKTKEGDICVFGAEKYFSVKLDGEKSKALDINTPTKHGITEKVQLGSGRRSRLGTLSVTSEASLNSQQPSLRNSSQGRQKKVSRKWLLAAFVCSRLCSDDNSVIVSKNVHEGAVRGQEFMKQSVQVVPSPVKRPQQRILANIEEHSGMQRLNVKKLLKEEKIAEEEEEEPEVSGSKIINKGDIQWYLERKLSMLTWDAIPKSQNVTTSSASSHIYADIESEGSSDLFEIDNLSVSRKPPYDLSFTTSTMTPYSPSEKSVEWSVATASATDFSAVSDYYKMKMTGRPDSPCLATKTGEVVETKSLPDRGTKKPQSSESCRKFIEQANEKENPSNSRIKEHMN
ncbi:phytochrome kinase substrate-related family protein [Tripterygium wilfordii]|uniref:Phytochrome kinase substrate-related family protein n=1 Tax=Tripterygium wilfordii TaxID=458696 RepID=A0A7J7CJB4_TRIWF|nr:protein PHYTOCHROME KINASE SUBSTRATE 3-like [Tripterygium wilfordii]KAF5734147.1 phytochrome kinase substrate-related family protein [Tripterygium wilfordii]